MQLLAALIGELHRRLVASTGISGSESPCSQKLPRQLLKAWANRECRIHALMKNRQALPIKVRAHTLHFRLQRLRNSGSRQNYLMDAGARNLYYMADSLCCQHGQLWLVVACVVSEVRRIHGMRILLCAVLPAWRPDARPLHVVGVKQLCAAAIRSMGSIISLFALWRLCAPLKPRLPLNAKDSDCFRDDADNIAVFENHQRAYVPSG